MQLRTDLSTREERAAHLADALAGLYDGPATPSPIVGGRRAALERLGAFAVGDYARTRNDAVRRGVSALSMYIRHGALGLAELRDYVLARFGRGPGADKFVNELGWRAFFQEVYAALGERVHQELEPPKHRVGRRERGLPADVLAAETGAACIDESLRELYAAGYMHNHGRMWVAAYLQHWRGVDWRDGAELFYRHLLDGDPASNSLSWQWVGGTFSHKPYFFNRQNVERFSGGEYCRRCPLARGGCPFDDSYENLAQRLFGMPLEQLERGGAGRAQRGGRP
jgi:deoxyribodipyrimidine photo-lyase